jgi:hypothetical protein
MAQILSYFPGQVVTLFLDTKNSDGYYADGYYQDGYTIDGYESPVIFRLIKPNISLDGYYPQPMTKFDTGIYYYKFLLPAGAASVGSYWADIAYRDPDTKILKFAAFQILVNSPYGLYSLSIR